MIGRFALHAHNNYIFKIKNASLIALRVIIYQQTRLFVKSVNLDAYNVMKKDVSDAITHIFWQIKKKMLGTVSWNAQLATI